MRENFNRNKRAREESKKKKRAEKALKKLAKNNEPPLNSEPIVQADSSAAPSLPS